jgi:dTMP kinase
MQKGHFIVLEGGEGVGKSRQRLFLEARLPTLFPTHKFVCTREPGGAPFADKIRELILSEDAKNADGLTNFGLFLAARADHVAELINPALANGEVVVCDRYLGSTYAYQIVAQERPQLSEIFFAQAKLVPVPDLTIWLDMEPKDALARLASRIGENNHLDARDISFHERCRAGFTEFFEKTPGHKMVRIDASRGAEEVWKDVEKAVASVL